MSRIPILNAAVQIGVGIACGPAAPACLAGFNAAQTFAITGSLGASIRAGAVAFATGKAFSAIGKHFTATGKFFGAGVKNGFNHIAAHALVGGVSSTLQGGKFGHGFFTAGITKGLTPQFAGIGGPEFEVSGYNVAEAAIAGILGGTISKITGGKFANGAVTAAMGNLFNEQRERKNSAFVKAKIKGALELGYDSEKGFSADFIPTEGYKISLSDAGKVTINQGTSSWVFDGTELIGGGLSTGFKEVVSASLSVTPMDNGDIGLTGTLSFRHSIAGFSVGGTTTINLESAVLNGSGLLGGAARGFSHRNSRLDAAIVCQVEGSC